VTDAQKIIALSSIVNELLSYAEHDDVLSDEDDDVWSFPSVTISRTEEEIEELKSITGYVEN